MGQASGLLSGRRYKEDQGVDALYRRADHVIAISPFLAEMGRRRYGDKFSVVPLGINDSIFIPKILVR